MLLVILVYGRLEATPKWYTVYSQVFGGCQSFYAGKQNPGEPLTPTAKHCTYQLSIVKICIQFVFTPSELSCKTTLDYYYFFGGFPMRKSVTRVVTRPQACSRRRRPRVLIARWPLWLRGMGRRVYAARLSVLLHHQPFHHL